MHSNAPLCVLCAHLATITDIDRGNRQYVACSNASCGDYEISWRAALEIVGNPDRKRLLQETIVRANIEGKVLEIFVDAAGNFDTTIINAG